MKKTKFKMTGNGSGIEKISESSCLCASVLKKDAGVVEGGFSTETQRLRDTEFKMTEIGLIPEDWEVKRLGEVCETSSGGTPSRSNLSYYDGNIKWFTTTELQDCDLYDSNEHISREALKKSSAKIFPCGTLLMAMYGATIGRLGVLRTEAATNQACCAIFCGNLIDTVYTYYYLYHSRLAIIEKGCGAGQPNISQEIVRSLWISLPPLPEQKKIAEVLSDVDELLAAMTTLIEKKRAIKQGAMQELLTGKKQLVGFKNSESSCLCASVLKKDAGTVEGGFNTETQRRRGTEFKMTEIGLIPEDWEVKPFPECFSFIRNNTYARESLTDSIGSVANIHYGDVLIKYGSVLNFARDSVPYLKSGVKPNRDMLKNGDLVFADTAEDETVGKAVEVQGVQSRMVVAGLHTVACRPREGMFAPRYLGYYINSPAYHNQLLSLITGTKVSSVSRAGFLSTYVVLPPLHEQEAIAEVLSDMDAEIEALEAKRAKYESIKQGMMQELLTGKTRLKGV